MSQLSNTAVAAAMSNVMTDDTYCVLFRWLEECNTDVSDGWSMGRRGESGACARAEQCPATGPFLFLNQYGTNLMLLSESTLIHLVFNF